MTGAPRGPTDAEIEAIAAADSVHFARNFDREWLLRLPMPGERGAAVAVHRCGPRVALTPEPSWTATDVVIERIVREHLPPAAWAAFKASLAPRQS